MERADFSSQTPLSAEDIVKTIDAGVPALDASRTKGYAQLGQLRDAKARSLSREQTLLTRKHGAASAQHPRIAEARQRFAANENLRREIAVVRETNETPLPGVGADSMVVHGFVRRRNDRAGIAGLTLALTDGEGNWVRELGYACTDQRGYFLLQARLGREQMSKETGAAAEDIKSGSDLSVDEAKREAEARREAEAKAAAARRAEAAGAPAASASAPRSSTTDYSRATLKQGLLLRVYDRQGRVLHTEERPVLVRAQGVDYRIILLGDEEAECGCTPPPAKAGGRPAQTGPKPSAAPAPAAVRSPAPSPAAESRVGNLKSYQQPPPPSSVPRGTPLEAIRGIGPKGADKLRRAGIDDVAEYEQTPGAALVKVAGFDKVPPKSTAASREKQPAVEAKETRAASDAKTVETAAEKKAAEKEKMAEKLMAAEKAAEKAASEKPAPEKPAPEKPATRAAAKSTTRKTPKKK